MDHWAKQHFSHVQSMLITLVKFNFNHIKNEEVVRSTISDKPMP